MNYLEKREVDRNKPYKIQPMHRDIDDVIRKALDTTKKIIIANQV